MGTGRCQKGKPRYPVLPLGFVFLEETAPGDFRARGPGTSWATPMESSPLAPGQGYWGAWSRLVSQEGSHSASLLPAL